MRPEDPPGPADSRRRNIPLDDASFIELGEPIHIGGDVGWLCPAKIVGRGKPLPRVRHDDDDDAPPEPRREPEVTHTLLVCTGRGHTADDAQADAVRQLEQSHRPPQVRIEIRRTDPPASKPTEDDESGAPRTEAPKPSGWRAALRRLFG